MAKRIIISVGCPYRYNETVLDLEGLEQLQAKLRREVSTAELIRRAVKAYLIQHGIRDVRRVGDDRTAREMEFNADHPDEAPTTLPRSRI